MPFTVVYLWTTQLLLHDTATQVDAISYYGGAQRGMRTMLDAFLPAVDALEQSGEEEC